MAAVFFDISLKHHFSTVIGRLTKKPLVNTGSLTVSRIAFRDATSIINNDMMNRFTKHSLRSQKYALIALFSASASVSFAADVDFNKDVKPILEFNCVRCHHGDKAKGKLRLDNKEAAFKGGEDGVVIVAGRPRQKPALYRDTFAADDDKKMPPKDETLTKDADRDF